MASQQAQLQELFVLLADARTTVGLGGTRIANPHHLEYCSFDHICTFEDEVKRIWKTRLSLLNVLYVWIRYFTLISVIVDVRFLVSLQVSDKSTVPLIPPALSAVNIHFTRGELVTSTITVISTDVVLAARVWILYKRSRKLLVVLMVLLTLELITAFIVGVFTILPLKEFVHVGDLLRGCYSTTVPRLYTFYSVPLLSIAFIMFILTLYKCGLTIMALRPVRTPLLSMFLRDGVFWFLGVVLCCLVDFVIWSHARPSLARTPSLFTTALVSVIGTRVIMNLKNAIEIPWNGKTTTVTVPHSFAEGTPARRHGHWQSEPWYLRATKISVGGSD
ncbi:hypothetical protein C8F01DRAFT_1365116 [Mycena amicta]|nr:hypothetical protein C8F01DRAFT_1365116 [Mycena amicta]